MKKKILGGLELLSQIIVWLCYTVLFNLYYQQNIWKIYNSYHRRKKKWKRHIWNYYMVHHAASISIDASIASPLILPHGVSGIFITKSAIIGRNVVIFQQVTIGANTLKDSRTYGAPTIGDDIYIGAGAKIIGNVNVGNNSRIGANAVIVKDIPSNSLAVNSETRIIIKEEKLDNKFYPYLE